MSDTQRDREERQHVIEVLKSWDGYFIGYTSDEVQEALRYAIASIKTDLKYDLLYEETTHIADADKKIESTTKNDKVDCEHTDCNNCVNSKYCDYELNCSEIPTGSTTKNDLVVDCISRKQAIRELKESAEHHANDSREEALLRRDRDIIKALPPVTPIRPKGHWIGEKKIGFGEWKECIVPLKDGYVTDSCSCSECGEWLTGSDEYLCSGNFCPCCGADMREVEE